MKIIITVNKYNPNFDGVQFVTNYLSEGLVKKGHNVILITSSHTLIPSPTEEILNGVKIYRKDIQTIHTIHRGNKKEYQQFILRECKDADCIINVGTQSPFTDWCFDILKEIKAIKILYLHSIWDFKWHKNDFYSLITFIKKIWSNTRWRIYYNSVGKKIKQYDAVTQLHKKDYANAFFERKYGIKSYIIENAAEEKFFNHEDKEKFKKPFDKYIISIANYIDRKNQILAVDEFLKSNIDNNVGLVLIGSQKNKYYDSLKKHIIEKKKKLNLSPNEKPIKVLYGIDRNQIHLYLKNAYLYLMTSKWEAYPISLIEAMASKIPYISTNVGIVKFLSGGVVSSNSDINYWIETFFNNKDLRDDLGLVGYDIAKKYMRINEKVNQLENLINKLKKEKIKR